MNDRDMKGDTPFIEAAWLGHNAMLEVLVEAGASIHSKNSF